jgi:photosystem II stability/assembly factor-like uncharacterized protein
LATRTKKPAPRRRPVQHPKRRDAPASKRGALAIAAAVALLIVAATGFLLLTRGGASTANTLPATPDYHSLLVTSPDASGLLLGTHNGLYSSNDGGRTWEQTELAGQDAMNLAHPGDETLWVAGHNVFARSDDGGATWRDVRPAGLPSFDIHGFAVDPQREANLFAAVAGQGLYRSTDNGRSFVPVSRQVGGAVMALAVTPAGDILAGDMEQGLLVSGDGGKTWRRALAQPVMGIALNPAQPRLALATGAGVFRSEDQGKSWNEVLALSEGGGPVAWSPSNPQIAYAVSFDRTLYKTTDGGSSWQAVTREG